MTNTSPNIDVSSIKAEEVPSDAASTSTAETEEKKLFKTLDQLRKERYELQTTHIANEHSLRQNAFLMFYIMVSVWLVAVIALLITTGVHSAYKSSFLSDNVLIAMLGVATANVIGLLMVAAGYIFPKKPWWLEPTHPTPKTRASRKRKHAKPAREQ